MDLALCVSVAALDSKNSRNSSETTNELLVTSRELRKISCLIDIEIHTLFHADDFNSRLEMGDEMSKRKKFIFVTWIGPDVSVIQRAKMSTDKAIIKDVLNVSFHRPQLIHNDELIIFSLIRILPLNSKRNHNWT